MTVPHEPVTIFTNIPNPYNDRLLAGLRHQGAAVRAVYKSAPEGEGRHWPIELHPDDVIADSPRIEARAWKAAASTHVILTGSYATAIDTTRRLMVSRRARSLHLWGERLVEHRGVVHALRRGYFAPWRLDGILAIGSRARRTYREVTGAEVPVHTFPYTTDRGLDTPPTPAPQPTIGFAGRLLDHKGIDVALRALAAIDAAERPVLEIAGAGPERRALERLATERGLDGPAVRWLGELTPDDLDQVRASWWAQLVPTQRSEGWGVVVHEALNSAVPVISSEHVNAAVDLVRTDLDGTLIDATSAAQPEAWAAAIRSLVERSPSAGAAASAPMRAAARTVGAAFAPAHAAPWLLELLVDAGRGRAGQGTAPAARSFVADSWARLADALPDETTGRAR